METETVDASRAIRVAHALNRLIGILHAARCTISIWLHRNGPPAAKNYSVQMTYETAFLALRKFQDLWLNHLTELLHEDSPARLDGGRIISECEERGLRRAANLIAAHYANEKSEWPLTNKEIYDIIRNTGLTREEVFVKWLDPIGEKMITIRNEIMQRYNIASLNEAIVED